MPAPPPPRPLAPDQLELTADRPAAAPSPEAERLRCVEARLDEVLHVLRAEAAAPLQRPAAGFDRLLPALRRVGLGLLAGGIPPAAPVTPPAPRISLVVAVGDPALTRATLEAIDAQRYPALELILVGEAGRPVPPDGPVAERVEAAGMGPAAAAAAGLARATGRLVGWIEPGEVLLPGALARLARHVQAHPADRLIRVGRAVLCGAWRLAASPDPARPAGTFFQRAAYDSIGGLDPTLGEAAWPTLIEALERRFASRFLAEQGMISAVTAPPEGPAPARHGRLYFPAEEAGPLPPMAGADRPLRPARCPLTGGLPQALLFSTPDTRGGQKVMSDIWYHQASHCAAASPAPVFDAGPAAAEAAPAGPDPDAPSPFRNWRGPEGIGRRLARLVLPFLPRRRWGDPTPAELGRVLHRLLARRDGRRVLEIGCGGGELLDALQRDGWQTGGTEPDEALARAARARGHEVWSCGPGEALRALPVAARFDLVFLGHQLERLDDPLAALQKLARLLEPEGLLVVATPNLDSAQIDRFGPCWAHWQPPAHRYVLSRRTLALLAEASGLELVRCRSFSHPYWSWMSLRLSESGLMGTVPPGATPDADGAREAEWLARLAHLVDDWRGRGDYIYAALRPNLKA